MPTELHIGMDAEKTVISPYALRLRTGRAVRHRTGSTTEVVPVDPTGADRAARLAAASRLSLALIFVSAALATAGVPWWLSFTASVAAVAARWQHQSRAAGTASFEIPDGEGSHVLHTEQERAVFRRAVGVSRRLRRTWPVLSGMID